MECSCRHGRIARAISLLFVLVGSGPSALGVSQDGAATATNAPSGALDLVIRFEVRGGMLAEGDEAADLARWSLYADGLVVWTEEGEPTPGFTQKVWTGWLSKEEVHALRRFLQEVGFWGLADEYQPSSRQSSEGKIVELDPAAALDQAWSSLIVREGSRKKRIVVYPADWEGTPAAYVAARDHVLQIRAQRAREYEPDAFRLQVERLPSERPQTKEAIWPFPDLKLPGQSGELTLTAVQGRRVDGFLRHHGPVVIQQGEAFTLRLLGAPPRDP